MLQTNCHGGCMADKISHRVGRITALAETPQSVAGCQHCRAVQQDQRDRVWREEWPVRPGESPWWRERDVIVTASNVPPAAMQELMARLVPMLRLWLQDFTGHGCTVASVAEEYDRAVTLAVRRSGERLQPAQQVQRKPKRGKKKRKE